MKKSFLIFGVVAGISMTGAWAAQIGEVLGAGDRGYMACPPDCSFLRNDNGGLVTPVTCVNHGVECAGGHGGVRFYNEYPSQYATGEVLEVEKVTKKLSDATVEKSETASVARAAKVSVKAKKTVDTNNKPVKPQDMVADGGGAIAINCPANCTPDCVILSNVVLCECKDSAGKTCKADVVVSDEQTSSVK